MANETTVKLEKVMLTWCVTDIGKTYVTWRDSKDGETGVPIWDEADFISAGIKYYAKRGSGA